MEKDRIEDDVVLNPSCSTVCWRLNGKKFSTQCDTYPNNALDDAISALKKVPKKDLGKKHAQETPDGDGGSFEYIQEVVKIAKRVLEGKISLEKGYRLEDKALGGDGSDDVPTRKTVPDMN